MALLNFAIRSADGRDGHAHRGAVSLAALKVKSTFTPHPPTAIGQTGGASLDVPLKHPVGQSGFEANAPEELGWLSCDTPCPSPNALRVPVWSSQHEATLFQLPTFQLRVIPLQLSKSSLNAFCSNFGLAAQA